LNEKKLGEVEGNILGKEKGGKFVGNGKN